jgi:perosamine synthetase
MGKTEAPRVVFELETADGSIYGKEEERALLEALRNRAPSCGPRVKEFEDAFAAYCGVGYALAVTSATTGLTLAGLAAGIAAGDEVITTPISWIATAAAFSALGAKVKFCDVDRQTLNLDPDRLERLITPKTKAIVPVHLYGQCCRMDSIMEIARRRGVLVIEDCAHNPGGEYGGKKAGALGDIGVFSFHQQKNMTTLGEGGMLTTSDRGLFERALSYRSLCCRIYGRSYKYLSIDEGVHPMGKDYWRLQFDGIGYNFRMTDAQAAVGIEQLKKLDRHNAIRVALAERLTAKLSATRGLTLPYVDPKGKHVFHLYAVQLEKTFPLAKSDFMWRMYRERGIKVWSHYMPIHLTAPYREQGHEEGECPAAEEAFGKYVSLPIHPRLESGAIDYMAGCIAELATDAE